MSPILTILFSSVLLRLGSAEPPTVFVNVSRIAPGEKVQIDGRSAYACADAATSMATVSGRHGTPFCEVYCEIVNNTEEILVIDTTSLQGSLKGSLLFVDGDGVPWHLDQSLIVEFDQASYIYPVAAHSRATVAIKLGSTVIARVDEKTSELPKTLKFEFTKGAGVRARPLSKAGLGPSATYEFSNKGTTEIPLNGPIP